MFLDKNSVKKLTIKRPSDMHKGSAGRILIMAGSYGMAGAAVLSAKGALYSGAGIIKMCVPDEIFDILQISVPEAICINRSDSNFNKLTEYSCIAVGPGIGVNTKVYSHLKNILESYEGPVVVDADGLNSLSKYGMSALTERKGVTIITPHPIEADRMMASLGIGSYDFSNRKQNAISLSKATGAVVLLKGEKTIITDGNVVYENTTGNPGMATGGSGDVLTGIIAALCGSGYMNLSPIDAAALGAYIHGLAGDIACEKCSEISMTSRDISECLKDAYKEILA